MAYLVLARKWRPQVFEQMTGQEHVVRTLANALSSDRVAHAFLFCGPRGVGKTTAARLLAKCLNCQEGPTVKPCGQCASCQEIAAGTCVDVAEIDGASNNGVENVREIRENAKYLPQRDRHKIYIIDEVHMLSGAAFNALLKTLEEPPGHVKFIFATTEPHKLPDTILSRCQRHNFRRISTGQMMQRLSEICLAEEAKLSESALALIVRQSDGGMRDALSLLDLVFSAAGKSPTDEEVAEALGAIDRKLVNDLASGLVARNGKQVLDRLDEAYRCGVDMKRLAEEIALYIRHIFVTKTVGQPPSELAETEQKEVSALAKKADSAQLCRSFDIVYGFLSEFSKEAHPKLGLEMALCKAIELSPSASIPELLAKVEQLSEAVPGAGASGGRSVPAPFRA
jgi:DNA polymerase-3 subunit gamma/tau